RFRQEARHRVNEETRKEHDEILNRAARQGDALSTARADAAYVALQSKLANYHNLGRWLKMLYPVVGMVLVLCLLICLLQAMARALRDSLPQLAGALGCLLLLALVTGLAFTDLKPQPGAENPRDVFAQAPQPALDEKGLEMKDPEMPPARPRTEKQGEGKT